MILLGIGITTCNTGWNKGMTISVASFIYVLDTETENMSPCWPEEKRYIRMHHITCAVLYSLTRWNIPDGTFTKSFFLFHLEKCPTFGKISCFFSIVGVIGGSISKPHSKQAKQILFESKSSSFIIQTQCGNVGDRHRKSLRFLKVFPLMKFSQKLTSMM